MFSKSLLFSVLLCFQQVLGFFMNGTTSRVHYGKPVNIERVPHQVALLYWNEHQCGGSILTKQHVLSAGHCFYRFNIQRMQVRIGANGPGDSRGVLVKIRRLFMHPQYNNNPLLYDVAVVLLDSYIQFNERVQPIKLPMGPPNPGTLVLASGWGETEAIPGQASKTLMAVETKIGAPQECRRYSNDHPTHFCTTVAKHGVCHGDSGGPLMDVARNVIVGISSFVSPACSGNPGPYGTYFANVYYLRPFIDKILQQSKNFTEN